ncbi:MAG: sugar transferase [Patescibacteria group bacterium]|nr:sugar transferase [Patescibacteria group bacterium]
MSANHIKTLLLPIGDLATLYVSLVITLIIRYGEFFSQELSNRQAVPFSIIFATWILIFYIAGLYDIRKLRNSVEFFKTLGFALVTNAIVAIALFYLIPFFEIAPKTNLLLVLVFFTILELIWRRTWNALAIMGTAPNTVILIGTGRSATELHEYIGRNPQLGYRIAEWIPDPESRFSAQGNLRETILHHHANLIIIDTNLKHSQIFAKELYGVINTTIEIQDLPSFYELLMKKIPIRDIEERWVLDNITATHHAYASFRQGVEFCAALLLSIILLPLGILIACIIATTSRGPILIRQKRIGKLGKEFILVKFRSMVALSPDGQAETQGAQWATSNDARITPFGKIIRLMHLDEMPQLWNVLRGEISFVGPRPERPEFVQILKEKIPYYEARLLIKPGITGWAQIHHGSDTNEEDVVEKLQYDIYYIKNRSFLLDVVIILKTFKTLFVTPK